MVRRCLSIAFLLAGALLLVVGGTAAQSDRPRVVVGELRGIVNPVMAGYVTRVLDNAERSGAAAVVFTMDTPGGLSDAMRDINQRILRSTVPVIVYVAPDGARAGSAGVYISYAAHLVAMAPTTNIGSATPVSMSENGEQEMSPEMRAKLNNDAVAQIRALAEQRGRNADWAEKAVVEGANLHATEAVRQNVANFVASDVQDVLRQADGARVHLPTGDATVHVADAEIQREDMSALESFLLTITNPTIAYILLSIGSLGLIVELYNPGSIFPGVIGGISLLLAFYALGTLPVNFAGLALIAFGFALFALEPFVVSHGIMSVGGAIAFLIGSLLLINAPDSQPYLQVSLAAIVAMTTVLLAFALGVGVAILRSRRRRVTTGREGMIGATGVARSDVPKVGESGLVLVKGELWRAVSDDVLIPAGERVFVTDVNGLVVTVARASNQSSLSPVSLKERSASRLAPATGANRRGQ